MQSVAIRWLGLPDLLTLKLSDRYVPSQLKEQGHDASQLKHGEFPDDYRVHFAVCNTGILKKLST
ncbi:MAG TPA: hypothetical protein VNW52_12945 [Burkholderiaceae bacterium]|nr:hypothetical protein [Burkholderiaceae bacterium]